MPKFIVTYSERSDGNQCNRDYAKLVESSVQPTSEGMESRKDNWLHRLD